MAAIFTSISGIGTLTYNTLSLKHRLKPFSISFVDPMYNVALGLRAKVHTFIYLDVVLKVEQLLNTQVKPVFISPEISLGFRY